MTVDQHLGDARPRLVELGRAVRRLAEHDDPAVGEALDELAELMQIAEGLGGFRHQPAQTVLDRPRPLLRQEQPGGKPGGLRIEWRFLGALGLGPTFLPDQGHEGHGAEILLLLEAVLTGAANAYQGLIAELSNGDDQPSTQRELLLQGLGNMGTAGGNDDGLEGRFLRQSFGAVGDNDLGVGVTQPLQPGAGELCQFLVALDGEHLARHAAHHRRRIARAGADLEHLVAWLDLGKLEHAGDDIGLGDGLPRLDR